MYSKWTSIEDLLKKLTQVNYNTKIEKSGIPMMYDDNNLYIKDDETHTIVIGSTGSGKTQSTVLPQLRLAIKAEESFILHDMKGEIYNVLSGELKNKGYNTVVINLADPTKSEGFNPLSLPYDLYKSGNKDKAVDILENIAYYFLEVANKTPNTDPFWTNSAISLFTGLAIYLFENAKEEEININSIVKLAMEFDKITEYVKSLDKQSALYINLNSIVLYPPETKASIIAVFNQNMKLFASRELLSKLLSKTTFNIENIQKEKTAIFIISDSKETSRRLLPLIIDECYQASILNNNSDRRLNILIDEFEYLFPLNDFTNKLPYARGYNIKFSIYVKSLLELRNNYKDEYEILKMEFGNIIYLLANDIETLEEISRMCGKKDEHTPLISTSELKLMNNFEAVILIPRLNPIRTKLLPDYKIDWKFSEEKIDLPTLDIKEVKIVEI